MDLISLYDFRHRELSEFLIKKLGMTIFSITNEEIVFRREIKNHIVTVHIFRDNELDIICFLYIDGANIWWHKNRFHSKYYAINIADFNKTVFVRRICDDSIEFLYKWKKYYKPD